MATHLTADSELDFETANDEQLRDEANKALRGMTHTGLQPNQVTNIKQMVGLAIASIQE